MSISNLIPPVDWRVFIAMILAIILAVVSVTKESSKTCELPEEQSEVTTSVPMPFSKSWKEIKPEMSLDSDSWPTINIKSLPLKRSKIWANNV